MNKINRYAYMLNQSFSGTTTGSSFFFNGYSYSNDLPLTSDKSSNSSFVPINFDDIICFLYLLF
jgi:hypothetical protein